MVSTNPVAIITGASSGIGLGITQALLAKDYRIVATSRTISKSKDLQAGENLLLIDGDIGKRKLQSRSLKPQLASLGASICLLTTPVCLCPSHLLITRKTILQ